MRQPWKHLTCFSEPRGRELTVYYTANGVPIITPEYLEYGSLLNNQLEVVRNFRTQLTNSLDEELAKLRKGQQ